MKNENDIGTIIGPRFRGSSSRAHVSISGDEVEAYVAYRAAYRGWKQAQKDERRAVDENRSKTAIEMAKRNADAATLALSAAKATMHATIEEE